MDYSNIQNKITNLFSGNRYSIGLSVLFILFFILIAYITYNSYIKNQSNKLDKLVELDELARKGQLDDGKRYILVYRFYVDWCPACKNTKRVWDDFSSYVENNYQTQDGDIYVECKEIDCDDIHNKNLVDKYDIDGYPTIKIVSKNEVYEYNSKIESELLKEFLEQVIND